MLNTGVIEIYRTYDDVQNYCDLLHSAGLRSGEDYIVGWDKELCVYTVEIIRGVK